MTVIHYTAFAAVCAAGATAAAGCSNAANIATVTAASPGFAIANAAIALAASAAVGCNFQGCPYGSYCNTETKLCVQRRCEEGCPSNTVCNEGLHLCQAPALTKTPNDFLPQDRPAMQDDGTLGQRWWLGGL